MSYCEIPTGANINSAIATCDYNNNMENDMENNSIISKTIKINSPKLPPDVDFIIKQIRLNNIEPIRWAIVEIKENILTLSVSGYYLNKK